MKYSMIAKAYRSLMKLTNEKFNLNISYNIYKLIKLLQPQIDFETEQIKKLLDEYKVQPDENGQIDFKDEDKSKEFMSEYNKKMTELNNIDVELDFKKFDIALSENIELSPADIDALEPFVNFI